MFIQPITHHPDKISGHRPGDSPELPLTRLGGQPEPFRDWAEEATYQSSMKWKRFWSLELFFAFVRATAVQLSGIVPSLSMENVIIVEMQRSRFCFNSNLRNSWYILNDHSHCTVILIWAMWVIVWVTPPLCLWLWAVLNSILNRKFHYVQDQRR